MNISVDTIEWVQMASCQAREARDDWNTQTHILEVMMQKLLEMMKINQYSWSVRFGLFLFTILQILLYILLNIICSFV